MTQQQLMLEFDDVSKVYPGVGNERRGGFRNTSFRLEQGAFFTLLGPSGCGKTTTLRCIAGLETPDSGIIKVGGRTFSDPAAGIEVPLNERNLGMVFQSYAIWPHMTVFENVAFPMRVCREADYSSAEIKRAVHETLETVGLAHLGERSATRLSGGQQQRIALARAIVRKPKLLLLDEPLSNLDAPLREELRKELRRLQEQLGVTTVYVTHDQSEALEMSDQIAVMSEGHIVQMGTPHEIYSRPKSSFVSEFVGATNWLKGTVLSPGKDGFVGVRLPSGEIVSCIFPEGEKAEGEARIAIRPECFTLADAGMRGGNRLEGVILSMAFLGSYIRYDVGAGDLRLQVHERPGNGTQVGDKVVVQFDPADARAFTSA